MKIFANKNLWKKIVIIFLIINIFNFITPEPVSADLGGTLMPPIMSLFIGLGDGVNTIINLAFLHQENCIVTIRTGIDNPVLNFLWKGARTVWEMKKFEWNMYRNAEKFIVNLLKKDANGAITEFTMEFQKTSGIVKKNLTDGELVLPDFGLTPYQIISNKNDIFSVNIFKKDKSDSDTIISNFKTIVRDWYSTLRIIAIVGMMSVLIYIGIRIVISSTADSKAKYKQMLWDWLIATVLIFVMHYIMIFSNLLVDAVSELIDSIHIEVKDNNNKNALAKFKGVEGFFIGTKYNDKNELEVDSDSKELIEKAYETLSKKSNDNSGEAVSNYQGFFLKNINEQQAESKSDANILFWPAEDFIVQSRMYAQKAKQEDGLEGDYKYIGFGLIYVVLTVYIVIFSWVYLKRLIYMIFLTLISPLVALTYPIDKVKDGQAQAFNFWFREYMYNLLLQPLHLLLYMLLVGSAMQFATENPIYVVVSLGFMVPAEKLIKAMFGFKGQTPGSMPGVAAGALMMHATRKLFGNPPKQPGESANNNGGGEKSKIDDGVPGATSSPKTYNSSLFGASSSGENLPTGNNNGQTDGGDEESEGAPEGTTGRTPGGTSEGTPGGTSEGTPGRLLPSQPVELPEELKARRNANNSSGNKKKRDILGKSIAAGKAIKRAAWNNRLASSKWRGKALRKGIRTAAGVALGGTLASVGGLASIIEGDPSKAREYMTLGGLAGYKFGAGGTESLINGAKSGLDNINNAIDKEYYAGRPNEYAEKQQQEYIKNWKENQKNLDALRLNLGTEKANQMINDGSVNEFIENGFTDVNDMITAQMMIDDKDVPINNQDDAMTILKINKEIAGGNFNDLNPDDQDKWRRALKERFLKGKAQNVDQAKEMADQAESYLKIANDKRKEIR